MRTRNRVLVIIGVIALSLWAIYPPGKSLKLGLDLNGGVQLVLRVKTDDALSLQTRSAAEQLRAALTEARAQFSSVDIVSATEFRVDGVDDEAALKRAADQSASSYERTSSGRTHTFGLPPAAASALRDDVVGQAL